MIFTGNGADVMAHKLSANGAQMIKRFEGVRLKAYKASPREKYYTIGYGHYGADVSCGMTISQTRADELFNHDIQKFVNYVNNKAYCPKTEQLNQNQFDALVSFCYNLGPNGLKQLCGNYTIEQIGNRIPLFNKCGGQVLKGLVQRRVQEQKLYRTPCSNVKNTTQKTESEWYNMPTIRRGSNGKAVKIWQVIIGITADGNFGGGTESATRSWQKAHGLTGDGVVGPKSWGKGFSTV